MFRIAKAWTLVVMTAGLAGPVLAEVQAQAGKPGVDAAVVEGNRFSSTYFGFEFALPDGWKALDDALRVAQNEALRKEDAQTGMRRGRSRKADPAGAASASTQASAPPKARTAAVLDNYSLLVATPSGPASLETASLPRINIWASHRTLLLNDAGDPAQLRKAGKRLEVVQASEPVRIGGRDFVRTEFRLPDGQFDAQFVTVDGSYLIGFEMHAASEAQMEALAQSMQSVRFD